ncbi:MAG: sugar transferase [Planctomycetota bacterium]|nr:sugar transferase [Planctomycetota bacterium]
MRIQYEKHPSDGGPCGRMAASPSLGGWYARWKVIADVITACVLLLLVAPLVLVLMVLVRLTSPGPAIYSQVRTGRGGRPFRIFKLRSMANECERVSGPRWSSGPRDSRVTSLGRFLRRSHLDELPQLWNVIRREMSLVGPRPERPVFVDELQRTIPDYMLRSQVLPGITGLAQVQLPPDEDVADVRRKLQCDLCYIRRLGPWLDFRIMIATLMKVLGAPCPITTKILALPGPDDSVRVISYLDEAPAPLHQMQSE